MRRVLAVFLEQLGRVGAAVHLEGEQAVDAVGQEIRQDRPDVAVAVDPPQIDAGGVQLGADPLVARGDDILEEIHRHQRAGLVADILPAGGVVEVRSAVLHCGVLPGHIPGELPRRAALWAVPGVRRPDQAAPADRTRSRSAVSVLRPFCCWSSPIYYHAVRIMQIEATHAVYWMFSLACGAPILAIIGAPGHRSAVLQADFRKQGRIPETPEGLPARASGPPRKPPRDQEY